MLMYIFLREVARLERTFYKAICHRVKANQCVLKVRGEGELWKNNRQKLF